MQEDAGVEHPHHIGVVPVREERVARRPGGHAGQQHVLHAEAAEEPRHDEHEENLGHLAERHLPRRVGHAQLVQEWVRERVVELQRDADQERTEHEHRERAFAEQLQRVEAEDADNRGLAFVASGSSRTPAFERRRVRQGQTEHAEQDRCAAGNPQRHGGRFEPERADREPRDNPADRPEHADGRKLTAGVVHLPERQ